MVTLYVALSLLILVLCLAPFRLPRRLALGAPGWVWPIVVPAWLMTVQRLRGGERWSGPTWVYAFGAGVGLFIGLGLWYLKANAAPEKAAPKEGIDTDL